MEQRNFPEIYKIAAVAVVLLILLGGALFLRQQQRPGQEVKKLPANQVVQPTSAVGITSAPTIAAEGMMSGELVGSGIGSPTSYPAVGKYMLVPNDNKVMLDQIIELSAVFSAPGKILDGSDVFLRFDPAFLEVSDVSTGEYFVSYPRKQIDNKTGFVRITGIRSADETPLASSVSFSRISFKTKKTGTTKVTFEFKKGKTNRTTLVEKETSRNILGNVFPANITIGQ